jgi:hypothetical protein
MVDGKKRLEMEKVALEAELDLLRRKLKFAGLRDGSSRPDFVSDEEITNFYDPSLEVPAVQTRSDWKAAQIWY